MTALQINRRVRHAEVEGRAVLLDFRSEAYYVLDPVATAMWRQLSAGRGRDEAVGALAARFAADPVRLAADYDAFLARCRDAGLLGAAGDGPPATGTPSPRLPGRTCLTARAWWRLVRTARLLRTHGFARAYEHFGRQDVLRPRRPHDDALLAGAVRAFARAENFAPLRRAPHDCLPRSLALFGFLRSLGLPADHRIGVQLFPFVAHAWVEVGGRVVHDDPGNPRRFTVIASLPA